MFPDNNCSWGYQRCPWDLDSPGTQQHWSSPPTDFTQTSIDFFFPYPYWQLFKCTHAEQQEYLEGQHLQQSLQFGSNKTDTKTPKAHFHWEMWCNFECNFVLLLSKIRFHSKSSMQKATFPDDHLPNAAYSPPINRTIDITFVGRKIDKLLSCQFSFSIRWRYRVFQWWTALLCSIVLC